MRYLSETEKRQWNNIKKQFPYQWKTVDLHISVAAGVVLGLWLGFLFGLALYY
jgi:hypothetical protein